MNNNSSLPSSSDHATEVRTSPLVKDTFLVMPFILIIGIFIFQTAADCIDVTSMLSMPSVLVSPIIEAVFFYFAIKYLVRRKYKSVMSMVLAIPLLMFVAGIPFIYGGYTLKMGRYIKITLNEEQYYKVINETKPDAKGFRFKEFRWGGFMLNPVILIYDESDELALPTEQRSQVWWNKLKDSPLDECRNTVQKIKTHFYVVDFGC